MAFTTEEEVERRKDYDAYMRSPGWRVVRDGAFQRANFKCEQCGVDHIEATLQVHHLTYERFKNEQPGDVVVLCVACHEKADARRKRLVRRAAAQALDEARFEGWAQKVYGDGRGYEDWRDAIDEDTARARFDAWKESH